MVAISNVGLARDILAHAETKLKGVDQTQTAGFDSYLQKALSQVTAAQNESGRMAQAFESGAETDITKVMLAREKSSLAFEATLQVRNKLLTAYKDIVSMPV
jgi:flagellar hook-basal body complex protein FliE